MSRDRLQELVPLGVGLRETNQLFVVRIEAAEVIVLQASTETIAQHRPFLRSNLDADGVVDQLRELIELTVGELLDGKVHVLLNGQGHGVAPSSAERRSALLGHGGERR